MEEWLSKLLTFFIINKQKRRSARRKIRSFLYAQRVYKTARSVGKNLHVRGYTTVTKTTILGDNVSFNGMKISGGGGVKIGDWFHSGEECVIITQNHNYDTGNAIPYDDTYAYKDVEIGDFVWLGTRVMILPGTTIGEGAIIQAGAVVHGNIPPYAIVGGNPAKVFKYRDIEHFKALKAAGKFY